MLEGSQKSFQSKTVDYVFVSTHSQAIHSSVVDFLQSHGYRVEVSSDFENQSTSYDGFIFSSSPNVAALFDDFEPLGRLQITEAKTNDILQYLNRVE
jgi:DNA-directed RNA polymerase specialized sigma54-like protein